MIGFLFQESIIRLLYSTFVLGRCCVSLSEPALSISYERL